MPLAEITVFESGSNTWRSDEAWPPRTATRRSLYLHAGGALSFEPPATDTAFTSYVSDPAHPIPYRPARFQPTYYPSGSDWHTWLVEDQRFVDNRPDVLSWTSAPLEQDVVIGGNVVARLFAATTGTDADWVVKLIDVYPDRCRRRRERLADN